MKDNISIQDRFKQEIEQAKTADLIAEKLALLADISVIGAPFGSIIRTLIPSRRLERLEAFVQELAIELEKVKDLIDVEYLKTDEFIYLFEQCIRSALDNYQEEKQSAFKAIIINSVLPENGDQAFKEFFINLINQLTTTHFVVLMFCHDTNAYIKNRGIDEKSINGNVENCFKTIFSKYEFSSIRMAVNELNRMGLIELDTGSFRTVTVRQGMELIGHKRTTEAGDRFIDFITY